MSTWERLTRTKVFQALEKKKGKKGNPNQDIVDLVSSVSKITKSMDALLTRVQDTFSEYTLHDATHSVKIVELMDRIIPERTLGLLNAPELAILILSAYLHDVGMVKSREETKSILESSEFASFREETPSIIESIEEAIKVDDYRAATELEDALITEFIRQKHGKRTYDFIVKSYSNHSIVEYCGVDFSEDLALVCASHCFDAYDLSERKKEEGVLRDVFRRDKVIHDKEVNIQYLAVCLRLADIMDFDRERTPKILFKHIAPKGKISLKEWIKHLSITGWRIDKDEVRYEAKCIHPVYQNALLRFIDQIDIELERCNYLIKDNTEEISNKYKLELPKRVNRNYVLSKGFHYGPFQFSLDYDRILMLLMGEQLYEEKNVSIRELLQNSIDACRHRQAYEKMENRRGYKPEIKFTHDRRDGYEVIEAEDNGIGMDMNIIRNYFMRIGASYYRSREFDRERMEFRKRGFDFDPVSRFGIGILSCFMIADRVSVETYRAKSSQIEKSNPLEIEIEGPSQFFVLRDGKRKTYGTKVTLFLRKGQKIDLQEFLVKHAKHVEFPIIIKSDQKSKPIRLVDEGFTTRSLQSLHSQLEGSVSKIDIDLSRNRRFEDIKGKLSLFFLKDSQGKVCLETNDFLISGTVFRRRIDRKKIERDWFREFLPYDERERMLRHDSLMTDHEHEDGEMGVSEFLRRLRNRAHVLFPRDRLLARAIEEGMGTYIRNYMRVDDLYRGVFCVDGIVVRLGYPHLNLDIPYDFDINVVGEEKPNLRVARDAVADDEKLELFIDKIRTIVGDAIYEQILKGKISDVPSRKYDFVATLFGFKSNSHIFRNLLRKENFRKECVLLKVQRGKEVVYASLSSLVEETSGGVFLREARSPDPDSMLESMPIELRNKSFIGKSEGFLIDLVARSSELTFFSDEKHARCYFELLLRDADFIQDRAGQTTFARYSGKYEKTLYCENRLMALNSNHFLIKLYFRLKNAPEASGKEVVGIFERLHKKIVELWRIDDKKMAELREIVAELKRRLSCLSDISERDLKEIALSKEDFHFW